MLDSPILTVDKGGKITTTYVCICIMMSQARRTMVMLSANSHESAGEEAIWL